MKLFVFPIILLGVSQILMSDSYRILAILPMNLKSHFLMFEGIMKSLAKRGHHVDVISHFPQKKPIPNYHDVVSLAGTSPNFINNLTKEYIMEKLIGSELKFMTTNFGNELCELLELPKMKNIIQNPPEGKPYNLVISQVYAAHCFTAFGYHFKVPVVGISTSVPYPWMNHQLGNPDNPAYVPNALRGFVELNNFWERLKNTVHTVSDNLWFNYYTSPQDAVVQKHFGPDAPSVRDLERSVALLLANSHHSLNGVRPLTPAVVEVGGLHIHDDHPEISPELQKWLDESTDGFVYFSFGSMVRIETFSNKMLDTLYTSFRKITPIRVLMKVVRKDELPPGLPENVMTLPWIPQYQVLKHKNIRAFMTHGGLLGTQEAAACGVPMIGVPLIIDQITNIKVYVDKKIAIHLDFTDITVKKLDDALNTVLNDPNYRKMAKKVSAQFLDRPMSAIDTAIFWIEYVIRNGPNALRSPVLELSWWQAALLDVFGFLLLVAFLVAYMLKIIFKIIIAILSGDSDIEVTSRKKRS